MEDFNKDALLEEIKTLIGDSTKGTASETELNDKVEAINKQLATLNSKDDNHEEVAALKESVDKLVLSMGETNEALKAQGEEMKSFTEQGIKVDTEKPVSFRKALENAFMDKKDTILKKKDDDSGKRLSLKD